jgi:hypothetical protein
MVKKLEKWKSTVNERNDERKITLNKEKRKRMANVYV